MPKKRSKSPGGSEGQGGVKNTENEDSNFNVYAGSELGAFKGVCFGPEKPILRNFHNFDSLTEKEDINRLVWLDDDDKELLLCYKKARAVKVYNTKMRMFVSGSVFRLEGDDKDKDKSDLIAVQVYSREEKESDDPSDDNTLMRNYHILGLESGKVHMHSFARGISTLVLNTGSHLCNVVQSSVDKSIVATGGKENDLKIWDLNSGKTDAVFEAKNVPHDFLDMRVPVWVQDLTFMPGASDLLSVCSRYGQVRLYDVRCDNRNRPVVNMVFADHACMSISSTNNNTQVLVGSAQGVVGLVDLRQVHKNDHQRLLLKYSGFKGSIRSVQAHHEQPYFASCGLDRHLYLHKLDQKVPLKKLFLKSRLNCVVMTRKFEYDSNTPTWQNVDTSTVLNITPAKGQSSGFSPKKAKYAE